MMGVANDGDKEKEESMSTKSPSSDLSTNLREAITKQFPTAEFVVKASYERVSIPREQGRDLTVGYFYPSAGKPAVETADGNGGWTYHRVHAAADVKKAVAAMRRIEVAAAKKAKAKS
jgi:hypothetical protein